MKITFVVPALNLTGGLRVVSIYAKLLAEKGHQVTIVSPNKKLPSFKEKIKLAIKWKGYKFKSGFNSSFFSSNAYDLKILNTHRAIAENDVPDADLIIATFWNTAEWIANFSDSKGHKVYFIQHYEMHPWLPLERVKATFSLPYTKIVVSQWIADVLLAKHKIDDVSVVSNGVDLSLFYSPIRDKQEVTTFGVMYSHRSYKGCQIAFAAYEKAKNKARNRKFKLVAFGTDEPDHSLPLPAGTEYFCLPEQDQLRSIYGQCDAWIFSSSTEGFGLPILEAMACRTPVIGTNCGAAEMLINTNNGFLLEVDDVDAMSRAMISVSELSNSDWQIYSKLAYSTAVEHKWSETCVLFENVLLSLYRRKS